MDIEGGEYNALLGAEELLKNNKPVIILATHGDNIYTDCVNLLNEQGYKIDKITDSEIIAHK